MADTQDASQEIYARLLARDYAEQLFGDLPDRKREKSDTRAGCPFCHGHNFTYSHKRPLWRCFNCDKQGDWLAYLMDRQRLSFLDALQELAQAAGIELELDGQQQAKHQAYVRKASLLEAAQERLQEALWEPAGQPVLQYLLDRGYKEEEIRAMGLGAYISRQALQEQLLQAGYKEEEIKGSGLLTKGLGASHQLSLAWRDPSGRATGLAVRAIQPGIEPKYLYSAGLAKSQGLIGLEAIRGEKMAILLEGLLDALYLNSMGLKAVAIGGTDLSLAQIKALEANGTKELILALDADQPGQAGTEKAIRLLRPAKIRAYVLSLPQGYKDPDELVRDRGPEALRQALRKAEAASSWLASRIIARHDLDTARGLDQGLEEALDVYAQIEDAIEARAFWESLKKATSLTEEELEGRAVKASQALSARQAREALQRLQNRLRDRITEGDVIGAELALSQGLQEIRSSRGVEAPDPYLSGDFLGDIQAISEGLSTGYSSLYQYLRIPEGAISIMAGRPGHGKTTLLLNLLLNMIRAYPDKRFYFFSYEEARSRLALKLLMIMAGEVLSKDTNQGAYIHYLREKKRQEPNKKIEEALQEYQKLTVAGRLTLSDQRLAGQDLASTMGLLARRGDTGAVFVDYIQRIPIQGQYSQRYLEIKAISEMLLDQAVRHNLPVIVGAQLNRTAGGGSKPKLEQLREAGDLEQDAHLVIGLYNQSVDQIEEGEQIKAREVDIRLSVLKHRSGMAGLSSVLTFDRPILRIKDTGSGSQW